MPNGSPFNRLELNRPTGAWASSPRASAINYVLREPRRTPPQARPILKIGTYPIPDALVRKLVAHVETILVAEEGYPLIERSLKGLYGIPGKTVIGKLSGHLPLAGELTPESVRAALGLPAARPAGRAPSSSSPAARPSSASAVPTPTPSRPSTRPSQGRPGGTVFSDIGCYTLGWFPPHSAVDTCVCMGASIGMAKGAAEAGVHPSVAVIGDSTFGHSGITAAPQRRRVRDANMIVIVLDNCTVAMTGGQPSFASATGCSGSSRALGVPKEHIRVITPLPKFHEDNVRVLTEEIEHPGLSVIVAVRECLEEARKEEQKQEARHGPQPQAGHHPGRRRRAGHPVHRLRHRQRRPQARASTSSRPRSTAWPSAAAPSSPTSASRRTGSTATSSPRARPTSS